MNPLKLFAAALVCVAASVSETHAADQVGILVEFIEVDQRTANKLIRKHATQLSAAPFRDALDPLIKSGEAKLAESSYLTARNQSRAKIESIDELIYPTEPDLSGSFIAQEAARLSKYQGHYHIPSTYSVRNIGTTIEVDPSISPDRKSIDLQFAPEIVRHLGNLRTDPNKDAFATNYLAELPLFATLRSISTVTIKDRDVHFVGQFSPSPKRAPGARLLLFVHARILP